MNGLFRQLAGFGGQVRMKTAEYKDRDYVDPLDEPVTPLKKAEIGPIGKAYPLGYETPEVANVRGIAADVNAAANGVLTEQIDAPRKGLFSRILGRFKKQK